MKKTVMIGIMVAVTSSSSLMADWISSPVQYGLDKTSPEELRELRKAVNGVIIPPYTQAISCENGGQIDITYQDYFAHTKMWGDYRAKIESETFMRDAKNGMLKVYDSHYYFNKNTVKIDDKHFLCIPKDTAYNKDLVHKNLNKNVVTPPKTSLLDKFLNYFKG